MIHAGRDQHRLRVDLGRLRGVLQQLDETVAEHHLAGGDRDLLADREVLRARGTRPPSTARCASSSQFLKPRIRLWPDSAAVRCSSSGLVCRKFAGEAASSSMRPAKFARDSAGSFVAGRGLQRLLPPGGPIGVGARVGVEGPDVPGGCRQTPGSRVRARAARPRRRARRTASCRASSRRRSARALPAGPGVRRDSDTSPTRRWRSHPEPDRRRRRRAAPAACARCR